MCLRPNRHAGTPQSKLSYHLKMLLEANIILMERIGKWNYYELNDEEIKGLLSEKLCCIFYPNSKHNFYPIHQKID